MSIIDENLHTDCISLRTQVTAISKVGFRCMQSCEKLFSIRILFFIIHEQLTEFTCDLLHTVYKYLPYACLSFFF